MSFIQFDHCDICRISHKQGGNHVYSAKHRKLVKESLNKFHDKIKKASEVLSTKPKVVLTVPTNTKECQRSFWCTTCGKEFPRHGVRDEYFVENLGLIEHLVCESHVKNLKTFWCIHRLKKLIPETTCYAIDSELHKRILENVTNEEEAFKMNLIKSIRDEVDKVRKIEETREKTLWQLKLQELRAKRNKYKGQIKELVSQKPKPEFPPDDSMSIPSEQVQIGPTKDDFLIHKFEEEERKRQSALAKVRTDLSSRYSTSLHNKVWLPYKVRRSLQRSRDVKDLANEVREHYSKPKMVKNWEKLQDGRDECRGTGSDVGSQNHISTDCQNGSAVIRPYVSKRKSMMNNFSSILILLDIKEHPHN